MQGKQLMGSFPQPTDQSPGAAFEQRFRARPVYRVAGYAAIPGAIAAAVVLASFPLPDVAAGPLRYFRYIMAAAIAFNVPFALYLATVQIVLTNDGIRHSAMGMHKSIRFDEVCALYWKPHSEMGIFQVSGFMRIGDGAGTRILIGGYISQYDDIARYAGQRLGGRQLASCPPTVFERLRFAVPGVFVAVIFVLMCLQFFRH